MVFTSAAASVVSLPGYGATRNAIQTRKPAARKKVSAPSAMKSIPLIAVLRDRVITAVGK